MSREELIRLGHVEIDQAVHRGHSPARPHRGRDEAAIRRKRSHVNLTRAVYGHGMTLPPLSRRTRGERIAAAHQQFCGDIVFGEGLAVISLSP
jgi:hypothetical protein